MVPTKLKNQFLTQSHREHTLWLKTSSNAIKLYSLGPKVWTTSRAPFTAPLPSKSFPNSQNNSKWYLRAHCQQICTSLMNSHPHGCRGNMCVDVLCALIHCYMRQKWHSFKSGKRQNEDLPTSAGRGEEGDALYYAHWHQRKFFTGSYKSFLRGNRNIKIITITEITAITTTTTWYRHANKYQIGMLLLPHVFQSFHPFPSSHLGGGGAQNSQFSMIHNFILKWKPSK